MQKMAPIPIEIALTNVFLKKKVFFFFHFQIFYTIRLSNVVGF